jgi:hypothetical protein
MEVQAGNTLAIGQDFPGAIELPIVPPISSKSSDAATR